MVLSAHGRQKEGSKKEEEEHNNTDNNLINNTENPQQQKRKEDKEPRAIKMAEALQKEQTENYNNSK
jgi:hypothetical protein